MFTVAQMAKLKANKQFIEKLVITCIIGVFGLHYNLYAQPNDMNLLRGVAAFMQNDNTKAIKYFSDVINSDSSKVDLFIRRGKAYLNAGLVKEALNDFQKAEKIKAGTASLQIAECYAMEKQPSIAVSYLQNHLKSVNREPEAVIKLDKNFQGIENTDAWKGLWKQDWYSKNEQITAEAEYLINTDEYVDALSLLNKSLSKNAKHHEWYFLRSSVYQNLQNLKNAIKDLDDAISLNKRHPEYYAARAALLMQDNKYKQAVEDLNRSLKLDPTQLSLYKERAEALRKAKKLDAALSDIRLFNELFPHDTKGLATEGMILYDMEKYTESIKTYSQCIELDHAVPEYYYDRGLSYLETRDYAAAIYDFSQALDLNPRYADAWYHKGITKMYNGDAEGACFDMKKAAELGHKEAYNQASTLCGGGQ